MSASIEAARELIGYEPVVSIEDGLAEAVGHRRELFSQAPAPAPASVE